MATKTALVLEGGGMRGMFTAGVLDVLAEHGKTDFSHVYGVSAGVINGANFLAGQPGRFCRDVLAYRDDPNFMGPWSYATTGNVSSREFLYEKVNKSYDPYDYATFNRNETPFTVVATDLTFGTPVYLDVESLPEHMDAIVASSSLPCLSETVEYQGNRLLDGGTSDSVPVERALADGAERLVVVLTRHWGYQKRHGYSLMPMAKRLYADYPYYLQALDTRAERYNAQRETIGRLQTEGVAEVVAPTKPVEMSVLGSDGHGLLELYVDGRRMGASLLDRL